MFARTRLFLDRHPLVRDALRWAIPAIIFGAALRLLLLSYLPYAFWGADSRSYFGFAHKLVTEGNISLPEKRRFLYPILMVPVALLPGAPLRWLAVLQHALGVVSLVPLAYIVRKTFVQWRLWIVPVTGVFAGLPVVVWYEHELLGENVSFATFLWAFAGWCAWLGEARIERARRLFWWFFVPFALFILTKASGRFVWPGIGAGLVLTGVWRSLGWRRLGALGALMVTTLFVGSKKQGAWLFYTAVFPLTQLDTPLHADYKAQIRDLVEPLWDQRDSYYTNDAVAFDFLDHPDRPLWAELGDGGTQKPKIFMDLALEAVQAHPGQFLWFSVQRTIASASLSDFAGDRFTDGYCRKRTAVFYTEAEQSEKSQVRTAFGLPRHGPIPPYAEFVERLNPTPHSWQERIVLASNERIGRALDFFTMPHVPRSERHLGLAQPKFLAWWLLVAVPLAFLPRYRRTLGVWTLAAAGYLLGVFLVSQHNARYFGLVWPVLLVLFAVPADVLGQMIRRVWSARSRPS